MVLSGTPIHRDAADRSGLLSHPVHNCLTFFITSPFPDRTPDHISMRGLACVACESVPYVMDLLGNRGRHHLDSRRVPLCGADALRATDWIFADP
jgi:hypothetical protein